MIKHFREKFLNLDFGLKMIAVSISLIISNSLLNLTLGMMNAPNTVQVNIGLILTLVIFALQISILLLAITSVLKWIKQNKTNNKNEQSN